MIKLKIKQYESVLLKDGRQAIVVEILDGETFVVDIGDSPENWETTEIKLEDIDASIHK